MVTESVHLPDADAREAAETTFDRNVVVLAGAGTGKTTLLVNRLLHAVLGEPHPIKLENILALTFTNKAANEMKLRLRERLQAILDECRGEREGDVAGCAGLRAFQDRYLLSTDKIRDRAEMALKDLEKAHIRTLHSFAASVLRLYPLEAHVAPNFQEDAGSHFEELFDQMWDSWLEGELGPGGLTHARWESVLQRLPIQEVRSLALMIARQDCELTELRTSVLANDFHQQRVLGRWLMNKAEQAQAILRVYRRPKPRKIERSLEAACRIFEQAMNRETLDTEGLVESGKGGLESAVGTAPRDWDPTEFQLAKRIIQSAQHVLKINHSLLEQVLALISPCVERVRQRYRVQGWIGFDGLLTNVRNLLRDYPLVREQMKQEYQAILIDEFQDTDPLQYEILLYLAECSGQHVRSWQDIQVVPGKLFIVGDPKQSIYAFRRADIAAFDQVVNKLVQAGALMCTLTTNFRSHRTILQVVNAVFDRLLIQKDQVQPPHVPLQAGRESKEGKGAGVELFVLAQPEGEREWDTERASRAEAEWLGDWIQESLSLGRRSEHHKSSMQSTRPGDIAVLFRKLTNAQWYVEALRRRGIPYVTDGERHFYQRQEVIDLVNVLRLIDDPADSIALIGMLRSSLGGVPDSDIMALAREDSAGVRLDVSHLQWLEAWQSDRKESVRSLCERLAALHRSSKRCSISHLLNQLFVELPLVELAAASSHGEQAVVNLWKLRAMIVEMGRDSALTISGIVSRLVDHLRTHPQEAEAPLAEDSLDAVRVLTIHKAKGLEFPVVILPGLHVKAGGQESGASLTRDWISGLYGCTFSRWCNASQLPLWEKQREQEEAEQRRVLYVGMTRAKDRLVLSGGLTAQRGGATPLGLLREMIGEDLGNPHCSIVQVGPVSFSQTVVGSRSSQPKTVGSRQNSPAEAGCVAPSSDRWKAREERWRKAQESMAWTTPSSWQKPGRANAWDWASGNEFRTGPQLGILIHRFLELCPFSQDEETFHRSLDEFCRIPRAALSLESESTLFLEMKEMLSAFPRTRIFRELQQARILGREVPVTVPWVFHTQRTGPSDPANMGILEGVLDVVYEKDGDYWVGDYKTDAIDERQVPSRLEEYRCQAELYAQAVSQSLGLEVKGCKLLFLRLDRIEVVPLASNGCTKIERM
ncbi:MAG: UvrD-helicase domain-containing protein [Nitrospirales bacterium]